MDRELDKLADCIRLAFEDPDIYIREMLTSQVLYVKWKRAALLQSGGDASFESFDPICN